MRLEFSFRAKADLESILDYLAREAGSDIALQYGRKIREECFQICLAPRKGKRHPLYPKIRKIVVGSHKIFYREVADRIVIHRIWDGRRGINPNLSSK